MTGPRDIRGYQRLKYARQKIDQGPEIASEVIKNVEIVTLISINSVIKNRQERE